MTDEVRVRRRPALSKADKALRRSDILSAAKQVFARNGFHTTTIGGIAKEAGLAYGSVYQYFQSKEDVFHAVMTTEGDRLRARMAAASAATCRQPDDSWEPLRATMRAAFDFFEGDEATTKLLLRDAYVLGGAFEEHLMALHERFIDDIESQLAFAEQCGTVLGVNPRMVAFSISALAGRLAARRLFVDDGATATEAADFVVALFVNALTAKQKPELRS